MIGAQTAAVVLGAEVVVGDALEAVVLLERACERPERAGDLALGGEVPRPPRVWVEGRRAACVRANNWVGAAVFAVRNDLAEHGVVVRSDCEASLATASASLTLGTARRRSAGGSVLRVEFPLVRLPYVIHLSV